MTMTTANGDSRALPAISPLAVDAEGAAALCSISRRSWDRLNAKGMAPAPLRLGGCRRWAVEKLDEWISEGCPARSP